MTLLRELALFVTQANAGDLPKLDREILCRHASDVVVARLAGARTHEGRSVLQVYGGVQTPEAVAGLAALVRLTEMDDIHVSSNTTPSSVTVSVALALAAQYGTEPREIESAIYVGTELLVRFGKAMDGARALLKGFWPTRTAATLAACATAARIWGLSPDATHEALSLALTMTNGRAGRFFQEPSGRWIVFAAAVANGVRAAMAARAGFNGGPTPPTADWLATTLGLEINSSELTASLGQGSVFQELSLKPYGTARQSLSAAEAMRALVAQGLDPAQIRKVTVRVPSAHVGMIGQALDPGVRATSFVSVAAQVATAALMPAELYDVERAKVLSDPRVLALAGRCDVVGDPALDALFPAVWAARLDVETEAGSVSHEVREPLGSPQNRMDDAAFAAKAAGILEHSAQAARAPEIIELGKSLFSNPQAAKGLSAIFVNL